MQNTIIPITYIERKPDSVKYRIVGKGVTVEFLSSFIDDPHWPVEHIAEQYNLTPAEIYAAWSFYYDHKSEIDAHLSDMNAALDLAYEADTPRREALRRKYEQKTGRAAPSFDE